jgi:CheY-like chemotaxis protein
MAGNLKKKILLVDDEYFLLEILKDRLEFHGYATVTASDGKEGVAVAKAEKPDLIFMDVMMPEMDGLEATKILKACDETKKIPIVCLSALGRESDIESAKEAGADDYMVKPFQAQALLEKIEQYLGKPDK